MGNNREVAAILTPNELEVMEVLWDEGRPLTRSEIIELSPNRSWKLGSIHLILNSMLGKGTIAIAGVERTGKTFGRAYTAVLTPEEHLSQIIIDQSPKRPLRRIGALKSIYSAMVDDGIDDETLKELHQMIEDKMRKLGE